MTHDPILDIVAPFPMILIKFLSESLSLWSWLICYYFEWILCSHSRWYQPNRFALIIQFVPMLNSYLCWTWFVVIFTFPKLKGPNKLLLFSPNNEITGAHWTNLELDGVSFGLNKIRSPNINCLVLSHTLYSYQSGHQRLNSSLFWLSFGCFARKINHTLPLVWYSWFISKVEAMSTWTRYQRGLNVFATVYLIKIACYLTLEVVGKFTWLPCVDNEVVEVVHSFEVSVDGVIVSFVVMRNDRLNS